MIEDILRKATPVKYLGLRFVSGTIANFLVYKDWKIDNECRIQIGKGEETFRLEGYRIDGKPWQGDDSVLTLEGCATSLLFVASGEGPGIAQHGAGSQKQLLAFAAVAELFGEETRELVEDVLLGFSKDLWHRMAERMRDAPSGVTIFPEDDNEC